MFDSKKLLEMIKQAGIIQKNINKDLKNKKIIGLAGGDLVKVIMNGHFEIIDIKIDKNNLDLKDVDFLQDMIKAAINDGVNQINALMGKNLKSFTENFNM